MLKRWLLENMKYNNLSDNDSRFNYLRLINDDLTDQKEAVETKTLLVHRY